LFIPRRALRRLQKKKGARSRNGPRALYWDNHIISGRSWQMFYCSGTPHAHSFTRTLPRVTSFMHCTSWHTYAVGVAYQSKSARADRARVLVTACTATAGVVGSAETISARCSVSALMKLGVHPNLATLLYHRRSSRWKGIAPVGAGRLTPVTHSPAPPLRILWV
jgi:hypothetical protein